MRKVSTPLLILWGLAGVAVRLGSFAWGEETGPSFWIGLEETIARAIESDKLNLYHKAEWFSSDMRMEDLRRRGGWSLELLGRDEGTDGNRRETRDISRGRDPQDNRGRLLETERFIEFGLVRELWEEQRQNRADVSDERIAQLDNAAKVMVDLNDSAERAAAAFLEVYYGRWRREFLNSLVANEEEALRVLEVRLAQEEILSDEVLEARALLAELRGALYEVELALARHLDELRAIWGSPDLEAQDLGEPYIGQASQFEVVELGELVGVAVESRFDFRAAEAALEEQRSARGLAPAKPELEFGMVGRYGSYDRDYLDEGRDDSTFDLRFELGLNVPLSLSRRNEFRLRRHELLTQARLYNLEALREELRREVRAAHDAHLLAKEVVKIEELKVAKEEETERVTRLTALTMPESLSTNPESATREAENALLQARIGLIKARQEEMQTRIELLAAIGRLAPSYEKNAEPPPLKEN